jgi:hypothetical protein
VEDAFLVHPLVRVRAEEISLRLNEISGQPRSAIAVVVRERRAERREADAIRNTL